MKQLVLILHDIRSAHNVGSILRSADAFGVERVVMTGITPYPQARSDTRLLHVARRASAHIAKTALGAEKTVPFNFSQSVHDVLQELRRKGYDIIALEQGPLAIPLASLASTNQKLALVLGNEVSGLPQRVLDQADVVAEIPMFGQKESLNVSVVAGIALFQLQKP